MPRLFQLSFLILLAFACRPALAQSPLDDYLDQRVERRDFDKEKWKSLSKGIDYSKEKRRKKEEPTAPQGSLFDAQAAEFVKWLVICLGVAALIFFIVKMAGGEELFRPGNRKLKPAVTGKISLEQIEENLHEAELQDPIRQAVLAGDYVLAVRLYYLSLLKELSLKKHIRWKRDKTNGEYLRELAGSPTFRPVQEVTLIFERVWYGEVKLTSEDFLQVESKFKQVASKITALLLLVLAMTGCGGYLWWEHYRPDSKDPYGAYLVHNLLKDYFPGEKFVVTKDSLGAYLRDETDTANYVYVGNLLLLDSADTDDLLRFVERGNRAFIACPNMPVALLDSIAQNQCLYLTEDYDSLSGSNYEYDIRDSLVHLNFMHADLVADSAYAFKFVVRQEAENYRWTHFSSELFCDEQNVLAPIGTIQDSLANFVRASYGAGEFYLHATPLAFTNFHLMNERGLEYAGKVFSHLHPGAIYWDKTNRAWGNFGGGQNAEQSPFQYILKQPSLAWAWYILLGLAVLYLAFRAKRRQRIIPVLEHNANTSLEFIGAVGRLLFLQNNPRALVVQKMKLFLGFIRERYRLQTKELNEVFVKQVAAKSEIPETHIRQILTIHGNIPLSGFVSENTMIDFHRLIEHFYRHCK